MGSLRSLITQQREEGSIGRQVLNRFLNEKHMRQREREAKRGRGVGQKAVLRTTWCSRGRETERDIETKKEEE